MRERMPHEPWHYRAFTAEEHRRRIARGRGLMEANGLAACVCTSPELLYYFTGYEAHTHHAIGSQAMVLAAESDAPLLILRDGEPGEPEVTLSPLRYHYQHRAEIEAVEQGAARDAVFDTLTASIGAFSTSAL